MHARVATYRIISGTFAEISTLGRDGMLPIFQASPGFVRYGLAATGDDTFVSISLWTDRASAEAAVEQAAAYVDEHLADRVSLATNSVGDLAFYEGSPVTA